MRNIILSLFKSKSDMTVGIVTNFKDYQTGLLHSWLKTLTILGMTLVPIFFILDIFMIPKQSIDLLPMFGMYRGVSTAIVILQFIIIRHTKPSKLSFLHGYIFMLIVGIAIILMTIDLGGFNSSYYAGLNLVIIAINLLLPWEFYHSAINGSIIIILYVAFNFIADQPFLDYNLINNLYFMSSTVIIAASINHVKYLLIQKEFESRQDLKKARDSLWSEMEIAKKIQTALLPRDEILEHYEIAAFMKPATEVGGDYYDIITTSNSNWVAIGDVSGHGVESGLIMMMTQTGIRTSIQQFDKNDPSSIIAQVNKVITENIVRLDVERYMTLTLLSLLKDEIIYSGKHQDILVCRNDNEIEAFSTNGTWIGFIDDISPFLINNSLPVFVGDVILLFTDGITELVNHKGEMFGEQKLIECLKAYSSLPPKDIISAIFKEAEKYQFSQDDDITLLAIKRI